MTTYLIKMVLCSGILLFMYSLFLANEKMHGYNRFYLLLCLLLSFIVPLITIQLDKEDTVLAEPVYVVNELWEATAGDVKKIPVASQDTASPPSALLMIYLLVSGFLFVRFTWNVTCLWLLTRRNEKALYGNTKLVLVNDLELPYSFLSYVLLNKNDWQKGNVKEEILHHELTHVRQKHSLDVFLVELLLVFAWF
ncbi:MAG TPA: hypothetical protein VF609_16055, partial [Flavisolibacter sp.]